MITRLEISGFKTFNNFDLEFSPFTVIAGPNGSGKSNLFDAIQLLGRIAESDLQTAFLNQRGDSQELFTLRADGTHAQEMKFAVELLIDKKISDKFGGEDTLKYTRLRYELRIRRARDKRNLERLTVAQEKLEPIPRAEDNWFSRYISTGNALHWRPTTHGGARPFIDTVETDGKSEIFMRQDGGSRRGRPSPALGTEQTVLSSVSKIDFLHVFAVKQEMMSWRFLQLNPVELRKPSPLLAKDVVAVDGSNLPAALARMEAEDEHHLVMSDLSHEIHQLLPGIRQLELDFDEPRQQHVLYAIMTDGRRFSSRVLSEGTLRLLALCAFKYDTQYNGVLCFEEPENGVHPYRLRNIVRLLSGLSTDFDDVPADVNSPASLRQLLINTHSPGLLASLVAIQPFPFTAHFASLVTRINPGQPSSQCTEMRTINFNLDQHQQISFDFGTEKTSEVQAYSLREAITYLQSHDVQDALQLLTDQPVSTPS